MNAWRASRREVWEEIRSCSPDRSTIQRAATLQPMAGTGSPIRSPRSKRNIHTSLDCRVVSPRRGCDPRERISLHFQRSEKEIYTHHKILTTSAHTYLGFNVLVCS